MTALKRALAGRFAQQQPIASVLAVVPDASDRVLIKAALDKSGLYVECVASGYEALRHLWSHSIDVVLCDSALPGDTWQELVEEVANFRDGPPLLLATDGHMPSEVPPGVFSVIRKPFEAQQLISAIARAAKVELEHRTEPACSIPMLPKFAEATHR